jgi:cell division protease FtsH
MLSGNREVMDRIAAFLTERETITGKEFMALFNGSEVSADANSGAQTAEPVVAEESKAAEIFEKAPHVVPIPPVLSGGTK